MKKLVITAVLATNLVTATSAGTTAGFEAGYLTDNQDTYWAGRVGWQFNTGASLTHQVEVELGYTKHTDIVPFGLAPNDDVPARSELMPLTINYRAETTRADKLGFYFGAGLGQTRVRASMPGSGVLLITRSESMFTVQAFTGLNYKITPTATLDLGAKYLWLNEVKMLSNRITIDADLALTAGVSIRF